MSGRLTKNAEYWIINSIKQIKQNTCNWAKLRVNKLLFTGCITWFVLTEIICELGNSLRQL